MQKRHNCGNYFGTFEKWNRGEKNLGFEKFFTLENSDLSGRRLRKKGEKRKTDQV
jgi:hypothetical protein